MVGFFRRVEKKYILNERQYILFKNALKEYMVEDEHGVSTICNIYFDTQQYELVQHSITKPVFKDKIRLRSYNIPNLNSKIYLEIKRKYDGVVSKRRIEMNLKEFYEYMNNKNSIESNQVKKELDYYFKHYELEPKMFLSYYREAFYGKDDRDLRITFDNNIIARNYDLNIENGNYGISILDKNKYIVEIKTLGAMPMWLVKVLDELKISPAGFSKYGEAYTQLVLNRYEMVI